MSTLLVTLNTVYETTIGDNKGNYSSAVAYPTVDVKGGTLNIYGSNNDTQPANAAAMTLDLQSPLAAGIHTIQGKTKWILFETATGAPVVKTIDLIKG